MMLLLLASCKKESSAAAKEPEWLKQDLLAYFPFNGNAKDSSGNGFDGVPTGLQPTANRKNEPNRAISFLNGGYMGVNLNNSHFANDFTISIWAQLDSVKTTDPNIISCAFITFNFKSNKFIYNIWGVSNTHEGFIDVKNWNLITLTRKSDSSSIYLNGTYLSSQAHIKGQTLKPGNGIIFGREFFGNFPQYYNYNGKLDDIRIYKRALTAEEVKYLYQN
jgi:hypothetical protein